MIVSSARGLLTTSHGVVVVVANISSSLLYELSDEQADRRMKVSFLLGSSVRSVRSEIR